MARATDPNFGKAAATFVVRRLRDAGHIAYFAGGCVRDALLGLHPTDYDVATDAVPTRVQSLFGHTDQVGAAFGVVLVHVRSDDMEPPPSSARRGGKRLSASVEVATFRSDGPYADARRPSHIAFSDPERDAQRRDFTINALFLDPLDQTEPGADGRVIDYVGGRADLAGRVVRAVGDPDRRLAEDHLRALRAVRFATRLGFELDPGTAQAIRRHAGELKGVSRERIGEELRRMLAHPSRVRALELLQELGLDSPVLGEPTATSPLPVSRALVTEAQDAVCLGLAAWATDRARAAGAGVDWLGTAQIEKVVTRYRTGLCLSNEETRALAQILRIVRRVTPDATANGWTDLSIAGRKRLAGGACFGLALALLAASDPSLAGAIRADVARLEADGVGLSPHPLVTGDDLVACGYTPGPRFKKVLEQVYDAQLEGRLATKSQGLELAAALNV